MSQTFRARLIRVIYRLFICIGVLVAHSAAYAQGGGLHGTVLDPSGAAVRGATVTAVDLSGKAATASSDDKGNYALALPPGTYIVTVTAPQFSSPTPVSVDVRSGRQLLDLHVVIGPVTQSVTVNQDHDTLNVDASSNVSGLVIRGSALDSFSDDPDELQQDLQALVGPSAGPNGGAIYIDGFSSGELPPKQSIQEIRINQNPFSPEYDAMGYGRIEIVTKPGANQFHGTVNYNLGSGLWDSGNPYAPSKPYFLLNELEGEAEGPLSHYASFFVSGQRNTVSNSEIVNAVVVDPSNFTSSPYQAGVVTPQALERITPRLDFRISDHQIVTLRYGWTHATIQDAGVGAFNLSSRGYRTRYTNQTFQAGDMIENGTAVNEARFQFYRMDLEQLAASSAPTVQVLGSFTGGGAQVGNSRDIQNNYEFQDYVSILHGRHAIRFGTRLRGSREDSTAPQNFNGTFVFGGISAGPELDANNQPVYDSSGNPVLVPISSIEQYRRTLLFEQLGDPPAAIAALGGEPSQFTINQGTPETVVWLADAALFAGDEWHVRPNVNLSAGVRYEMQTNLHDWRDWAPRLALAWSPKRAGNKLVIRAGSGIFYDRFVAANSLAARRYNGTVQRQYTFTSPQFFPSLPSSAQLAAASNAQTVQLVSPKARAEYIIESAATIEAQLPAHTSLALTYTNSHGLHMYRSEDANAPLPGSYIPGQQGSGVYPLGDPGPRFVMESSGLYNQNQIIVNVKSAASQSLNWFGFYVFNKALSNTDGVTTFPANPWNTAGEYSHAATDIRHRVTFGGSLSLRGNVRISPFIVVQSGVPFDITTGSDLYGTTVLNARPGIAASASAPGVITTRYGPLDPLPQPGERILPRNDGIGPGLIYLNMRLGKAFGFGRELSQSAGAMGGPAGGDVGGSISAATGRAMRGVLGAPSTPRRFNLVIAVSARNLLNHNNPGPVIGNISSPIFGRSNQVAGAPNGEGFYETAANRKLELQMRLTF